MKTLVKILLIVALVWIAWRAFWWVVGLTFGIAMLAMVIAIPVLIVLALIYILKKL